MAKNPVIIHFDYMKKHAPELFRGHEMTMRQHERFSDHMLRDGLICASLLEMEATTRGTLHAMMMYARFGQHTYVVGPRVQDQFRQTDLSNVTAEMIIPPVAGFYISLPCCPWQIFGGEGKELHQVRGVYVSFTKCRKDHSKTGSLEDSLCVFVWGGPIKPSSTAMDDTCVYYSLNLAELAGTNEDIETYFNRHDVMRINNWQGLVSQIPQDEEIVVEHRKTMSNVLRLVVNLCLYLSSEGPDLEKEDALCRIAKLKVEIARKKSGSKRAKLERQLANLPRTRIVYVGPLFETDVPSNADDSSHAPTSPTEPREVGMRASPIEHAVRPHWRRYWVGAGDQRRQVLKFIAMFKRGSGQPDRTIVKLRE